MHKALQGYLSLSCCYITVDYPVAKTIPNAILFLAHTTTTVPFCLVFFTSPVFPATIWPGLHNTVYSSYFGQGSDWSFYYFYAIIKDSYLVLAHHIWKRILVQVLKKKRSPSRLSNTYQLTCIHQGCLWSWYLIFFINIIRHFYNYSSLPINGYT